MSSRVSIPSNYTFTIGGGLNITVPLMNVDSRVTGDRNAPVALHLTGDENEPVTALLKGDPNQPITTTSTLQGNPNQPITTTSTLQGDPTKPITSTIQGNRNEPIAAELNLTNLPKLSKQDIKDLLTPEVRVRIPNYQQVCFNLMGMELFSICTSGESQVITEPYEPNAYERCEEPCCEPDTRPFPQARDEQFDQD